MRKAQKAQAEEFVRLLEQAHNEIKEVMDTGKNSIAADLLAQCQEGAMKLGELIEKTEGEGFSTICLLERYCELVYQIHEELNEEKVINANNAYKKLRKALIQIHNSIRNDIKVRLEVVFLPYKASMWDSLESVWMAADADPNCDAYVVPIPYYDKNNDGSLGTYHYEGGDLPENVPVVHYDAYDLEQRKPDVIYIHNPYDNGNFVTTVDPRYYSGELKKNTDLLVYIPYYSTTGGMAEGQASCPAYYNADYIIIQAEKYRRFFAADVPQEKLIVLGSPKFDRVIRLCENPPAPPETWKKKMEGKKVYFYNTSIGGMLGNTEQFLKKMEYVFNCFKGREDACLLWRPHPLMESTFDSMRKPYHPFYEALKQRFIEEDWGIFDDTPDIEKTIALCDVYIGDSATSVTSLFGVAGKPLFILNNYIDTLPEADDWRGEWINPAFDMWGDDRYWVSRNNQLWFSEKNDYHYKFYMDLETGYSGGGYYMRAVEIKDKIYVLPRNARNLLVIEDKRIRKIEFKFEIMQDSAFSGYWYNEKYIFLFPLRYPFLVRFNIETEEAQYIDGIKQFNVRNINGEWRTGSRCPYGNELIFASPEDNQFLFMDMDTLQARMLSSASKSNLGTQGIVPDGDDLWLLPLNGMVITRWDPKTGELQEYSDLPQDFKSVKWPYELECEERPFGNITVSRENGEEHIVISPTWGNMYLTLDRETGRMEEWVPPITFTNRGKNCYFVADGMGGFVVTIPQRGKSDCRIWYAPERRLYDINIKTKECKEVEIAFDYEELREHASGFAEESEWMQYCLNESAFHSLKDLLNDNITGETFDRERQINAFSRVNVNTNGTCGINVYNFIGKKLLQE
ncbi:MAG: hypothetical protein K2K70_11015 [Lachnospiraceae bacterium]|nr:hypothetical protein [Lachnospiraceae bacterium]